ncbi:hypothetical protein BV22DRAFT_291368 [Leucogyrophana mollusca]|uniref:Uncharacterized protein n=1 Tax=Leucogyrophana mollusca TaxID=85980 RepID=A0ACB8BPR1_9AGAM|nr:hypothetical protein BV22DRAFT_291368 [Leucogyrophana mollusca]
MQLRIFAMYHQSRKVGILLVLCSIAEAAATVVILWLNLGPNSSFTGTSIVVNANRICASTGMRDRFMVMTFVPVVCFEFLLVALVARVSVRNVSEMIHLGGTMQANSLTRVLARDSFVYFLINLVLMLVVIALWVALPEVYGRVPAPLIDTVLFITGSRLVLSLRTRRARAGHQVEKGGMGTGIRPTSEGIPLHVLDIRGCELS